jgi:hypothetical protein
MLNDKGCSGMKSILKNYVREMGCGNVIWKILSVADNFGFYYQRIRYFLKCL